MAVHVTGGSHPGCACVCVLRGCSDAQACHPCVDRVDDVDVDIGRCVVAVVVDVVDCIWLTCARTRPPDRTRPQACVRCAGWHARLCTYTVCAHHGGTHCLVHTQYYVLAICACCALWPADIVAACGIYIHPLFVTTRLRGVV